MKNCFFLALLCLMLTTGYCAKTTIPKTSEEYFDMILNDFNGKRAFVFKLNTMELDTTEASTNEVIAAIETAEKLPNWIPEPEDDFELLVFRVPKGISPLISLQQSPITKNHVTRQGPSSELYDLTKRYLSSYKQSPEDANAELIKKIRENTEKVNPRESVEALETNMIGDYHYGEFIGKGQGSDVYAGLHKTTAELVVIKNEKESKEYLKREEKRVREAKKKAKKEKVPYVPLPREPSEIPLYNEFILYSILGSQVGFGKVYNFAKVGDFGVTVGEMLGESMNTIFDRCRGKLKTKSILSFALDALRQVEYFHGKNLLHRDLKSANFLLPKRGSWRRGSFYLIDFDSAKKFRINGKPVVITEDVVGTQPYMSVDVIDVGSMIPQTEKVDTESLGYMLIEFYRGSFPWDIGLNGTFQKVDVMTGNRTQLLEESFFGCSDLIPFMEHVMDGTPANKANDTYDYDLLRNDLHVPFDKGMYEYDNDFEWYHDALSDPNNLHITIAYKNIIGNLNENRDIAVVKVAKFYSLLLRAINAGRGDKKFKVEENLMLDASMLLSGSHATSTRHSNLEKSYVAIIVDFELAPQPTPETNESQAEKPETSSVTKLDNIQSTPQISLENIHHPSINQEMPIFQSMIEALGLNAKDIKDQLLKDIANKDLSSAGFAMVRNGNKIRLAAVLSNNAILTQIKILRAKIYHLVQDKKVMKLASEYLQQRIKSSSSPVVHELHDMSTYEIIVISVTSRHNIDGPTLCVLEALKVIELREKIQSVLISRFGFAAAYNVHSNMTDVVFIFRPYTWRARQYLDGRRYTTLLIQLPEILFMQSTAHYTNSEKLVISPETQTYDMVRRMVQNFKVHNYKILDPSYYFVHFSLSKNMTKIYLGGYDLNKFIQRLNEKRGSSSQHLNNCPPREMIQLAHEMATRKAKSGKILAPSGYHYEFTEVFESRGELLEQLYNKIDTIPWLSDPDIVDLAVGWSKKGIHIVVVFIIKLYNHDSLVLLDERRKHQNSSPLRIHAKHALIRDAIKFNKQANLEHAPSERIEWTNGNVRSAGECFHAFLTSALNAGMLGFDTNTQWKDKLLDPNMKQISFFTMKTYKNWRVVVFLYKEAGAPVTIFTSPPMLTPTFIGNHTTNQGSVFTKSGSTTTCKNVSYADVLKGTNSATPPMIMLSTNVLRRVANSSNIPPNTKTHFPDSHIISVK